MSKNQTLSERATGIHTGLKEKSFGIKDIKPFDENGVRSLRYWISLGMINGDSKKKVTSTDAGWDKFSFYEFIWILIVRELKEMNFDNLIVAQCANEVFSRKDPNHKMLLFEKAILFTLTNRTDVFFIVNKKGKFEVHRPEDLPMIAESKEFSPYVLINLLPLIKQFLAIKTFRRYVIEKKLLKETEAKTLELLSNNVKNEAKVILDENELVMRAGEVGIQDFIETIFIKDYKKIVIQF